MLLLQLMLDLFEKSSLYEVLIFAKLTIFEERLSPYRQKFII